MKSPLSASHLLRQFLLFVLTAIFLLTLMRAAYGLWQFSRLNEENAVLPLFVQGLRFDLALIGMVCLVPVVLGSLLAMSETTRSIARSLIIFFLLFGLFLILSLELITPWFVDTQGLRPDIGLIAGVENPVRVIQMVVRQHSIPLIIGLVLCILVMFAFWSRMELAKFLRHRVSTPSGIMLAVVGGLVCLMAIWSTPDLRKPAFSPANAQISRDVTINDLAMNTVYKVVYPIALPVLNIFNPPAGRRTSQD